MRKKLLISDAIELASPYDVSLKPGQQHMGAYVDLVWVCPAGHEFTRSYMVGKIHGFICRQCTPKIPHNKGKKLKNEVTRAKISQGGKGRIPYNKGQTMPLEQRIKLSVVNRGIDVVDFVDFTSPESRVERNKFYELDLHNKCFKIQNYTCENCGIRGHTLNAHHKNGWKHFPEQRFEITNLACLCDYCHDNFHAIYGNGKATANTLDQYNAYLKMAPFVSRDIIILAGVSGSGKSFIARALQEKYTHISMDEHKKSYMLTVRLASAGTILTDITANIWTWYTRLQQVGHNVKLVVIIEDKPVILQRLRARGSKKYASLDTRLKRMDVLAGRAVFSGTANEVLDYLKKIKISS